LKRWQNGLVTNLITFRPRSAIVLASLALVINILFVFQVIFYGDGTWLAQAGVIATTATLAWLLFLKPKVLVFDEGINIVNPFITATIGWAEVDEIETRYGLTIYSGEAKIVAWAAPAPGRYRRRTVHAVDVKGINYDRDFGLRPGDLPNSHSGAAAHVARTRRAQFERTATAASAKRSGSVDKLGIALLSASLVLLILGNLLHV
jgi:hypothetical protein